MSVQLSLTESVVRNNYCQSIFIDNQAPTSDLDGAQLDTVVVIWQGGVDVKATANHKRSWFCTAEITRELDAGGEMKRISGLVFGSRSRKRGVGDVAEQRVGESMGLSGYLMVGPQSNAKTGSQQTAGGAKPSKPAKS